MNSVSIEQPSERDVSRRTRTVIWSTIGALVLVVVLLLVWRFTQTLGMKKDDSKATVIPTVSVVQVGLTTVPSTVSIIGTISARYDMPIGIEGDGGRVDAIYVEAGDHVKRGQVLAHLNVAVLQPQVTNLEAALEQSTAEAELANAEYHRAQAVGASGALSAEETQRRKSSAATAAARVKVASAMLAEAKAKLARADVRAPADGLILTRRVEVGQTAVPGGEALFRLSKDGEVELRGQVSEQDLPLLKIDQQVDVKLTGSGAIYKGRIRLLGAVIDPQTRLGEARIALTPDPNLRPGAFARAEVTVSNAERAVLPQTAVLNDDKGTFVLVVGPDGKVAHRNVKVSGMVPGGVTIAEGVSKNDQIVTTAGAFLQDGEVVKPVLVAPGRS